MPPTRIQLTCRSASRRRNIRHRHASLRHTVESRHVGCKSPAYLYGWDRCGISTRSVNDSDFQTKGHIGIGVPAHIERKIHVFARIDLRRDGPEATAETKRDIPVRLIERVCPGRQVGCGASIDLQIERALLAELEFRSR